VPILFGGRDTDLELAPTQKSFGRGGARRRAAARGGARLNYVIREKEDDDFNICAVSFEELPR